MEAHTIHAKYRDPAAQRRVMGKLSEATGIPEPSPFFRDNVDKVLDNQSMLSDLALRLVLANTRKRRV